MEEYKFKGAYNANKYFDGYTKEPSNESFLQMIGGQYVDLKDVKSVQDPKSARIKEALEDENGQDDISPQAAKMMSFLESYIKKYARANGKNGLEASLISEKGVDVINHLIDVKVTPSLIRRFDMFLGKFYNAIGLE
jgi:hypothetical protein